MNKLVYHVHALKRACVALCVAACALLVPLGELCAQPGPGPGPGPGLRRDEIRAIPSERYYLGERMIQAGDFARAVKFYENEIRGAFKIGGNLWIDSICYYAMLGETYYQAGSLDVALKNYNAALSIAIAYPKWMSKVTYTAGVTPGTKSVTPWGTSKRNTPLGAFPRKATIVVGEEASEAHQQLGIAAQQHAMQIDPVEILRCVALAIRRRADIIGPMAPYDPMSTEILETFRTRAVAPNHWSIAFLDVIWGLALVECDKTQSAVKALNDALLCSGQFDHNLTCVALLELGHVFMRANKLPQAAECYYEASNSAYQFQDWLVLEESLRYYSNAVKGLRGGSVDPRLAQAYRWAKEKLPQAKVLQTSLALELLEDMIYSGNIKGAEAGLKTLDVAMRGEIRQSAHADRWNYLTALFMYAVGRVDAGDEALARVVEGAKVHSTWARQLRKLDAYVQAGLTSNGSLTPRNAADLYEYLLREPTVVDWAVNPTESLAIQMIAPIDAYERQFQLLMDRDLKDRAFEVAERIRRERFFATQTFGGRLLSLRYVMTADPLLTTQSIRNARESLSYAYPDFEESMKTTSAIMAELNALPTVPSDRDALRAVESLYAKLAEVSGKQEALLRFIAAGRVRIPYVFPPVYTVKQVQERLPDETAILSFIGAGGDIYGFMIGKENLDAWRVGPASSLGAAVATFLKTMGNVDGSRVVETETLADELWKAQGSKLREIVLGASDVEADRFNIVFSKLVVVPDGALWYLPFEALCLPKAASGEADDEAAPGDDASLADSDSETAADAPQNADASVDDPNATDPEPQKGPTPEELQAAHEAQYDDLDAAYYATEEELDALDADDETLPEEGEIDAEPDSVAEAEPEPEPAPEPEPVVDEEDLAVDEPAEEPAPEEEAAAPRKRMSRSARERAALKEFVDAQIPMIAAPDFTIRYAATVSLALPNAIGRNAFVNTTVIGGATYPRQSSDVVEKAVERFANAVSKTEVASAKSAPAVPGSIIASRLKRLVVFEEVSAESWNWSPIVLGPKPEGGNTVSDWIACPWGAPRLIVMPALRTYAENSLKNGGNGQEIALAVLAMQASGADTILLSRWRTGGRSAFDLAEAFVRNYEKEPSAKAWKDAVVELMERDVVVDEEPRLKKLGLSEAIPKYDAPFWWAGYILIDSGEAVSEDILEGFDEGAQRKADEENALLKEQKDGDAAAPGATENGGASEQPSGEKAVFVTPGQGTAASSDAPDSSDSPDSSAATDSTDDAQGESSLFSPSDNMITDDDLAAQDELGDDFFATEDLEEEEPAPAPAPKTDEKAAPAPAPNTDEKSEPATAPKSDEKAAPAPAPKTDEKAEPAPAPKSDEKKSSGRLSLKGKGKD